MIDKKLVTTLRSHSSQITCISLFYVPSTVTFQKHPILNPTLLTADDSGIIIWWNLATYRPMSLWQAHESGSPILTLKQLGLQWSPSSTLDFELPEISENFGSLLTHSKDGTIKIWKLIEFINPAEPMSGYIFTLPLQRKFPVSEASRMPPILFEMPVNIMNFSNIDMSQLGYLLTPATTNSNNIDLYLINLKKEKSFEKLKRLIKNNSIDNRDINDIINANDINYYNDGNNNGTNYDNNNNNNDNNNNDNNNNNTDTNNNDNNDNDNSSNRNNNGVIMKIKWISNNMFCIGYESGAVLVYKITNLEKTKIELIFENKTLQPNPITSIFFDEIKKNLIFGSTGSKICILNIETFNSKNFDINHKGMSDICIDPCFNIVALITWDGYTRLFEYNDEKVLKFLFKLRRQTPSIWNSKDRTDSQAEDIQSSSDLQTQRPNVIMFSKKQMEFDKLKHSNDVTYNNGRAKNIVRRNREEGFDKRWMFIGYKDGRIAVYNIKQK